MKVVFLDVDGVVNAVSPDGLDFDDPQLTDEEGWLWKPSNSRRFHPIITSTEIGPWLAGLGAKVVWATTWCHLDDQLAALAEYIGITDCLRVDRDLFRWNREDIPRHIVRDWDREDDTCGKREAVLAWMKQYGPVERAVWVDDELTHQDAAAVQNLGVACVRTRSSNGLFDVRIRRTIAERLA